MTDHSPRDSYAQSIPTPTATYDPLAEPFVPESPTDIELGRNWYWHYCMPCHGNVGQGLTDDFRAIWPEDHQNCWARGCHFGRREDTSFIIPTIVPSLVNDKRLSQFTSQQALYDYLKITHPPQDPGYLEDKIYKSVSIYVFSLNNRLVVEPTQIPTATRLPTPSPISNSDENKSNTLQPEISVYIGFGTLLVFIVVIWTNRKFFWNK